MNLSPLWNAAHPIPAHAVAAFGAMALGIFQMLAPKGTLLHRWVGRLWVLALGFVAASSFFIYEIKLIGPFSPIHLLSVFTLWSLFVGLRAVRRGDIKTHQQTMKSLFWLALVVTGLFTLLPGRTMYAVFFGS